METIIVFIDDAAHARQQLAPLCAQPDATAATPVHWVLVACAPRMTQRISKWVSHSARESWRNKWADKLFVAVSPWLRHQGHRTSEIVAKVPLAELTTELQARHAGARTLDARRPKHDAQTATGADAPKQPWALPGTLGGLGLGIGMLAMLGAE
jgi:hypothetical protein